MGIERLNCRMVRVGTTVRSVQVVAIVMLVHVSRVLPLLSENEVVKTRRLSQLFLMPVSRIRGLPFRPMVLRHGSRLIE